MTIDINRYRKISNSYGVANKKDSRINSLQQNILDDFENQMNYHDVLVDGVMYGVLIRESKSLNYEPKPDEKYIIMKPKEDIKQGQIVNWNSANWLCMDTDQDKSIYCKGAIQQCNFTIKYYNSYSTLITKPSIIENATMYSSGVKTSKFFTEPNAKFLITLPYDEDTKLIKRGYRFVISDMIGKVSHVDDYSQNGLIGLSLEEGTPRPDVDDLENGIADNSDVIDYNNPNEPTTPPTSTGYDIQITGNTSIAMMNDYTYTAKVYQDGVEVSKDVVWNISDSNLATLTPNGNSCSLFAENMGSVALRCELVDDETVYDEISIEIRLF